MRNIARYILVLFGLFGLHFSRCHAASSDLKTISLLPRLGNLHHPVNTTNSMAQRFFDQGLTFIFAFNHEAAVRSFTRALQHDPNLAMAQWGVGLALGPNINLPVTPEAEKAAYEATQKALELSVSAPEIERDYIAALAVRYSTLTNADLQALDRKYSDAMRRVAEKYPDDLDAATLYAESMLDLKPWQLWSSDGQPAEGTLQVMDVLESVLRRDPMHPGANHYYIHAVEASPFPERALPSALRLETYAPTAGHLVHMPAHVYMRVGDYGAAARRNEIASETDLDFIQACGIQGFYPAAYTSHNMHFAAIAHVFQGRYAPARRYAERLLAHVSPMAAQATEVEYFLPTLEQVLVAFRKWDEVMALPEPAGRFRLHRAIWHFARGMAFASTGEKAQAEEQLTALRKISESISAEASFGFAKASDIFQICEKQIAARLALNDGQADSAAQSLSEAVTIEDTLRYNEPPDWYLYSRELLGGVLLTTGKFPEAEAVFRKDLEQHRRNGRSLFGLQAALLRQGKVQAAQMVSRGFETAWENADSPLAGETIWWLAASKP